MKLTTYSWSHFILAMAVIIPLVFIVSVSYCLFALETEDSHDSNGFLTRNTHQRRDENAGEFNLEVLRDTEVTHSTEHVDEMRNIKVSVLNELRRLEQSRHQLRSEITLYSSKLYNLQQSIISQERELERLMKSIDQARIALRETQESAIPEIFAPAKLSRTLQPLNVVSTVKTDRCRISTCLDYSSCSLVLPFAPFIYSVYDFAIQTFSNEIDSSSLNASLGFQHAEKLDFLYELSFLSRSSTVSCLSVLPLLDIPTSNESSLDFDFKVFAEKVKLLPQWKANGRNHVFLIIDDADSLFLPLTARLQKSLLFSDAILVSSTFRVEHFRPDFDLISFPFSVATGGSVSSQYWQDLPSLAPARRKYLLSFWAECQSMSGDSSSFGSCLDSDSVFLLQGLRSIHRLNAREKDSIFHFALDCTNVTASEADGDFVNFGTAFQSLNGRRLPISHWSLCKTEPHRMNILRQSTFALIPLASLRFAQTAQTLTRLYEALKYGAIPVLIGECAVGIHCLPYSEVLNWKRCTVQLPMARLPELHFLLRQMSDSDLLEMRRNCRLIWETYLRTDKALFSTILAVLRTRLQIPPFTVEETEVVSVYNESFPMSVQEMPYVSETEEFLGPVELPYPSPKFRNNFTALSLYKYEHWNILANPFSLYPSVPSIQLHTMPSEAKFLGSGRGFRPVNSGAGGSGKEFSEALGGNLPREQFTIVVLTYERESVLVGNLQRLNNLPYLNKIIVVWNGANSPPLDLVWPKLSVPVVVLKSTENSLNNRFLPYREIETDAILSLDDDVHLRHDEILFAFRVWRESRDRIVGFPGRFHAWDSSHNNWLYNSQHSCELSMVLTGAAFFHKYYAFLYTYEMAKAIRLKVDELMNCEDLAMNFLVSHITRKPPIKVTSRWTFRCPGCPDALSIDDSHFFERHDCINFFTKVYGYNPLLYTQFRADSVLFKTRLPTNHQKCFKFI